MFCQRKTVNRGLHLAIWHRLITKDKRTVSQPEEHELLNLRCSLLVCVLAVYVLSHLIMSVPIYRRQYLEWSYCSQSHTWAQGADYYRGDIVIRVELDNFESLEALFPPPLVQPCRVAPETGTSRGGIIAFYVQLVGVCSVPVTRHCRVYSNLKGIPLMKYPANNY